LHEKTKTRIIHVVRGKEPMITILFKELSYKTVGAAMEVHRILGTGFPSASSGQAWRPCMKPR